MGSGSRRLFTAALVAAVLFALTGCGEDSDATTDPGGEQLTASPSTSPSATPSTPAAPEAKVIAVTITADSVEPDGARMKVSKDLPVILEIDAVRAGELHVHSTPEKEIEYPAGTSKVTLRFDRPGVVDVEDHGLGKLIVQLEVR